MKKTNLLNLFGVLLFVTFLSVAAPAQVPPNPAEDEALVTELAGTKWMLTEIEGKRIPKIRQQPHIRFDKEKGGAHGHGGCNGYGGKYETEGEKISLTDVMATLMGCQDGPIETDFFGRLNLVNRFKVEEGKLQLFKDEKLLLTFEPEKKKAVQQK